MLLIAIVIVYSLYPFILKKLFPIKYYDEILQYSEEYEIDPFLIAAVIRVESKYNPYAQSSKGARGLMQIMPITANWGAEEIGMENFYLEELFVPKTNIQIGTWYLRKLMNQFDRDVPLVLAAYNGGSGNVSKWLLDERYSIDGKRLDNIPFAETRNYVEKVNFFYKMYIKIYRDS